MAPILATLLAASLSLAPARAAGPAETSALTDSEKALIEQGPVSDSVARTGAIVGSIVPLGIGQAVQGRYHSMGWVFTFGEFAASAVIAAGYARRNALVGSAGVSTPSQAADEEAAPIIISGWVALGALRIWEIVDLWTGPGLHNGSYREALEKKKRLEGAAVRVRPYLAVRAGAGAVAGLRLSF